MGDILGDHAFSREHPVHWVTRNGFYLGEFDDFLGRHTNLAAHNDPEIAALKMELQGLERSLAELARLRQQFREMA